MKSAKQRNTFHFFFKISLILSLRDWFFIDSSASSLFHSKVAEETTKYFKAAPANLMSCEFSPFDLFFLKIVFSVLFANNIDLFNVKKIPDP